ncbi:MAG: hypothetical protein HRT95_20960 [Moritella sp.]|uniref:hypothetical protein n=1 Tax=Moritella sp. TaxID=78556 RepID=UPI001D6DCD54|nr:hypothetical protein [Moritella sp.]NQZ52542.1 hypothetical protein [Moritella sp.]
MMEIERLERQQSLGIVDRYVDDLGLYQTPASKMLARETAELYNYIADNPIDKPDYGD